MLQTSTIYVIQSGDNLFLLAVTVCNVHHSPDIKISWKIKRIVEGYPCSMRSSFVVVN